MSYPVSSPLGENYKNTGAKDVAQKIEIDHFAHCPSGIRCAPSPSEAQRIFSYDTDMTGDCFPETGGLNYYAVIPSFSSFSGKLGIALIQVRRRACRLQSRVSEQSEGDGHNRNTTNEEAVPTEVFGHKSQPDAPSAPIPLKTMIIQE